MEEKITLIDRDVLKVLAADTRMDILKILGEGARTPSDISKKLKKSDATIVEHLEVLTKAGLVTKVEQPGKKWVFYTLTDRGQGIISSKSRRLIIILSTSILAIAASVGTYFYQGQTSFQAIAQKEAAPLASNAAGTTTSIVSQSPYLLYASEFLLVAGFIGIVYYLIERRSLKGGFK
ncbi:MAG: winged helix-turn-helix transcriptional regulator [Candidatus Aenigmarchaeota archaeon]|nr:winged helix-turn-helix transcriptional regulator [Candidatus Aenigmarchaeota archaeon]